MNIYYTRAYIRINVLFKNGLFWSNCFKKIKGPFTV